MLLANINVKEIVMSKSKHEKVDLSRRLFFTKSAKTAVGIAATSVAATGAIATGIEAVTSATLDSKDDIKAKYAHDDQQQTEKILRKGMVVMSDHEKSIRLNEIIQHHQETV